MTCYFAWPFQPLWSVSPVMPYTKKARIVTNISLFIIKYRKVAQGEYMYVGGFDNVSWPHVVGTHSQSCPDNKVAGKCHTVFIIFPLNKMYDRLKAQQHYEIVPACSHLHKERHKNRVAVAGSQAVYVRQQGQRCYKHTRIQVQSGALIGTP